MKIDQIKAIEILDSRGNPTVETEIVLENGVSAVAKVPSGASTGTYEALELRDGDKKRYLGKGVTKAVKNVNKKIALALKGMDCTDQEALDSKMLELDGTDKKNDLGANAILSVSLAATRVSAKTKKIPLYEYVATLFGKQTNQYTMPVPMVNVINGGKHAIKSTDIQEYMFFPIGMKSIKEAVRASAEVFHHLGKIIKAQGFSTTVGDEGGYAPSLKTNEEPFKLMMKAIKKAGYEPGKDIALGIDAAANEFYQDDKYVLNCENRKITTKKLVDLYVAWTKKYPIVSIEDGFAEDDWEGFELLNKAIGDTVQNVGDDLYVTNTKRLKKGIKSEATNSILIKLNQIGTVTETIQAIKLAQENDMTCVVSHRSGETEDTFIADFVVGAGTGQIKTGSMSRSERIAKYNRLIRIEHELGSKASYAKFPFKR